MSASPAKDDAAELYDLKGLKCPLPVLKAKRRLEGMAAGTALWVETTDPLAVIDIPHFCREHGHLLEATEAGEGCHRFLIRKGAGGRGDRAMPDSLS